MPALSQLFPLSRLALPRRVPFWAQALAVCAVFAVAGAVVLDDYGISTDEDAQRRIAQANADYIVTGDTDGLDYRDYRYFGVAFEMPLLLAERALRLQDSRHIYLTRHLLTHLFFIAGGFACGMLAYRMLGSRWIALFAMLMFLLHPRLYAHSFFNSKDVPFTAMLIIALYLAHRAFRRDTLGVFLLCGVVVGLAIDMRPFALILLPLVLVMRAPDLWRASRGERKRILLAGAAFLAAALGTAWIVHPHYWENPLRFIESVRAVSQHIVITENLFMGEIYPYDGVPWNYIPVWFGITAPPVALALGAVGCAAVCWQAITRPIATLRDRETRFGVLLLGCLVLPVVAVIALQSNIYNGWRHMYFLWAPFCLLAAVGLHALVGGGSGEWARVGVAARLPGWVWGGASRRALAYGLAGVGAVTTLMAMAALHPQQQVYFNTLVDTKTPGALAERYDMDYWHVAHLQLLEYLLARYPDDTLRVRTGKNISRILPKSDRERIVHALSPSADFHFNLRRYYWRDAPAPPTLHSIEAYGSAFAFILDPNSDAYRDYYRAEYNDVEANGTLLARSDFDIYAYDGVLYYLSADCSPTAPNRVNFWIFLHIIPADLADLTANRREYGYENRHFKFSIHADFFDGKCVAARELPDYAIERIRTGQLVNGEGQLWSADINMAARAAAQAAHDGIAAGDYGASVAQSDFDVYLRGNGLAYLKESCAAGDVDARFFLHIFPADSADLPADWRERGFANLDFQFADHGAYLGNKCVAERELPGYAIDRIRTGQFVSGEGRVWDVEFPVGR